MTMMTMVKVMEREGKLGELEVRAETLHQGSEQFQVQDDKIMLVMVHQAWKGGWYQEIFNIPCETLAPTSRDHLCRLRAHLTDFP